MFLLPHDSDLCYIECPVISQHSIFLSFVTYIFMLARIAVLGKLNLIYCFLFLFIPIPLLLYFLLTFLVTYPCEGGVLETFPQFLSAVSI